MTEEALFEAALAKPVAERQAFLESECAGDPALLERLQKLVAAHERASGILDGSVGRGEPTAKYPPAATGFTAPTPEELAPLFPQLEIMELLGQGGMGAVYKARQPGLDRLVAVKILPPDTAGDPAFAERFTREARALAKLSHPHIVAVYDFGRTTDGGLFYFLMEYVDGVNLRQLIQSGKCQPEEALRIVPQICEALQFAHDEGVVHRDIKPENILLDKRGRLKIADFGLAKLLGTDNGEHALTGTHQVMGTLRYMAPEQMQQTRTVDHRADIFSLGVVFYELLTGELPMGKFAPPSKRVQVDVRLDEIVLRALEQEPEQRYQHASDVKTAVEVVSRSLPAKDVAAPESRETDEAITGGAVLRQSFLVLLSITGILTLFMPWTLITFGQTTPDGGGSFVTLAVHGVYHWFPVFGALLSAALLFVTLRSIGQSSRPLRAILAIAAGLALTSVSLFTIAAKPLTVHPASYSAMVEEMDEWSAHVKGGASALAELVRLSQTTERWTPGNRHVTIHAQPFFGSWAALGTGLLLLVLGAFEFTSVVSSSLSRMAAAPLQTAAEPAQALRLTGLLGPAALLIMLLMNMADVFINGGGAGSQPWSLLRTLLIWAFAVHLFHACFITPWILFGAYRLRTLSSPGAVRAASILAMLPLNFSAFVGIPAGLWSLFVLRGHARSSVDAELKNPAGEKTGTDSGSLNAGTPLTQMRFTVAATTDLAQQAVFHFSSLGYQLVEQQPDVCVFQRGGKWAGFWSTDIRQYATRLTVRTAPAADGQRWVSCVWSVRTMGAWITRKDIRILESEGHGLESMLGGPAASEPATQNADEKPGIDQVALSKRPRLVPVLATFNLVGAILLMLVCAMEEPADFAKPMPRLWQVWEKVDAVLGFSMAAGMFAASIGLFLWKPWARKVTLGVCVFGLASLLFDAPYLARSALPELYAEIQQWVIAEGVEPDLQDFVTLSTFVVLFSGLLVVGLTWLIGQLVYFNRPKVVAAFESSGEKHGKSIEWLFTGAGAVVGVLCLFGPLALLLGIAALFNGSGGGPSGATARLRLVLAGPHVDVSLNGAKVPVTDKGEAAMHVRPGDYEVVGLKNGKVSVSSIHFIHSGVRITLENREADAMRVTGPLTLEYEPGSSQPTIADFTAIQGRWDIVTQVKGNQRMLEPQSGKWIEFANDIMRTDVPETPLYQPFFPESRFAINSAATPPHFEIVSIGATGIYRLDGDTLTLAIADAGHPRPTEFVARYGSSVTLTVCRRAKAATSSASGGDSNTGEVWIGNNGAEIVMFLGPDSPTVSDRLASHLGLDAAQREAMNQAFQTYFREFKALEENGTRHETDANGHQITTIAAFRQEVPLLVEQFWSELDSALDGRQLTLGRKVVGLTMGMFESRDYGYRIEIWRVGQINSWYHWKEGFPDRANVTPLSEIDSSSGPELPEKLRRFWKEPATGATQSPTPTITEPDRNE
jgi:uncharacterized protein (TIGR03067 family)